MNRFCILNYKISQNAEGNDKTIDGQLFEKHIMGSQSQRTCKIDR